MQWTGQPPAEPGEFAQVYEEQIEAAVGDGDDQPATPPEIAREYEKHLERAREQAFRDARDFFIRRAYELDVGTQSELGDLFEMTQSSISRVLEEAPAADPRATATDD